MSEESVVCAACRGMNRECHVCHGTSAHGISKGKPLSPEDEADVRRLYVTAIPGLLALLDAERAAHLSTKHDASQAWTEHLSVCEEHAGYENGRIDERAATAEMKKALPDDLRADGWAVAVHNDYRQAGEPYTFWLLTRGERCVKGEGRTDAEALDKIRAILCPADNSMIDTHRCTFDGVASGHVAANAPVAPASRDPDWHLESDEEKV